MFIAVLCNYPYLVEFITPSNLWAIKEALVLNTFKLTGRPEERSLEPLATNFAISDLLQGVLIFMFVDKDAQAIANAFSTISHDADTNVDPN